MNHITTKVLIVGGGPGGYVAAIRCGQLGLDTVLVEKERLGGTCLIHGCIPSKAIIHAAGEFETMVRTAELPRLGITLNEGPTLDFSQTICWKDGIVDKLNHGVAALLQRAKVRVVKGWARFSDGKTCHVTDGAGEVTVTAEHVILATGSQPIELPFLPFGGLVISSAEALSLAEIPKRLAIIGAGYIGLELGIAFRKLGAGITIIEQQTQILPQYDEKLVEPVIRWLKRNGVTVHLGAKAQGLEAAGTALAFTPASGERLSIPIDKVLVTVGRRPALAGWGLEEMAVEIKDGFVLVDGRCATTMKNVWAIGDMAGEPMLAHKASAQGEMVAEIIAGHRRHFDPAAIPAVCFTEPEIVSAGMDPTMAKERDVIVSTFPLRANGRALTMNAADDGGFVRVVADRSTHRILGIQAAGRHISEMASAFTLAVEMGAVLEDVAGIIHAHPTLGEAFHEAALKGLGHAIHI